MYLYETHLHTCQASRCGKSTGAEHARFYKSLGYDGIFVTDHFFGGNCAVPPDLPWEERIRLFSSGYEDAKAEGDRIGLKVFFAWEESKQGDDYLVYGLSPQWLIAHPEIEGCTRRRQLEMVHVEGGCVVQAHPFRQRDYIFRILLGKRYADAVEVANAGNRAVDDICALHYAKANDLMMTCGSDNHLADHPEKVWGIGTEQPLNCPEDYVRLILNRASLHMLCLAQRFVPEPDMENPESYWLNEREEPVLSGVDWLHA